MSVSLLPFLVSTNRLDFLPCCPLLCLHTFGRKNTITWRISCRNFLIVEFQSQCIRPFPQPIRRVLGLQCQVSYPLFSIVVSTPSYRLSTYPADLPILNILESSGLGRTGRCHLPSVGGGGLVTSPDISRSTPYYSVPSSYILSLVYSRPGNLCVSRLFFSPSSRIKVIPTEPS